MTEFRHSYRVYFEDTDAGEIVYYANYLRFAERGRSETLRELGFECSQLKEENQILPVVRKVDIDYVASARLDDMLTVKTEISEVKGTSFWMRQTMEIESGECAIAQVLLVCVDLVTGKPVKIPKALRDALESNRMMLH
jgi:acyl-CoA thioester hydrolase